MDREQTEGNVSTRKPSERKRDARKLTVRDIALIGMMAAVLEVNKAVLGFLPNIELVSFWIVLFAICFGWRIAFVIPAFILVEGLIYGINLWWLQYLCAWPVLALASFLFRKQESRWLWSILSSAFGLLFGFFCAIPYTVMAIASGGLQGGLYAGFAWWVAGIRWDIVHAVGNFTLMFTLYRPVMRVMRRLGADEIRQ